MKTRFSRLLSLLLAITIVLSCVPMAVGAEDDDVVITIPTLVEGTVYETGTSIPLMVEHNSAPSTISHIDFYANGEKIPGNIPGNIPAGDTNKVLMWNKPLPGDYAVTAKIVYKATSVSEESDPVNIKVSGTEQEVFRFGADDSGKWTKSAGNPRYEAQLTDDNLSSSYTDFSAKTFTRNEITMDSEDPFNPLRLTQDVTRDKNKYKYLNVLMRTYPNNDRYVEGGNNPLPKFGFLIYDDNEKSTKLDPSNTLTLKKDEWTRLSLDIDSIRPTFNKLYIYANGYNGKYNNDESVYGVAFAGIFLSENTSETMTATPLIPEGSGVSCEMPAYRLNFNRSLNSYLTKDKLAGITITTDDGATNVSLDYKCGVDYLDLIIPKTSLELGKTYTVTIPENTLYDNYANYVPAQTFTFKTNANLCADATPIPYVTYPANGATVATEGVQLAAKVLFPPSDASDVVFYDNGTALTGTVTKGTGNEFVLNDVALAAGEHTITAKVGDAISEPVTITAAATTEYETLGVQDGDRVILNPQVEGYSSFQNKITVVDFSKTTEKIGTKDTPQKFTANPTATNVSQVIFDLDGVITFDTEAPYEFPLTNAHQGEHTLKVHVLSNNGAVWSETVRFTGIVGAIHDSESEDYENVSDGTVFRTYATGSNVKYKIETYNGSKMYKIYNDGSSASGNSGKTNSSFLPETRMEQNLGDTKIFYVDFDYVRSGSDLEFQMKFQRKYTYPVDGHHVAFGKLKNLSGTGSGHITMIMDCQNGVVSAYHNGTMYWYSKITDSTVLSRFQTSSAVSAMLYVANIYKTSWMYVDNLNIRTYSSAPIGDYALSGITANSDLAANENNYAVNVSVVDNVAAPETSATLKKAVFKLNGATIITATEAPFSCEVPLKTLGANKLTVETTDSYGVIKTINVPFNVSFKVDGASITELRADPGHAADKAVVANPGKEASYILYTAVYTSDKALKTVTTEEIKIGANEIKLHEANVTLGEGETVRLFTWKENLYPLD